MKAEDFGRNLVLMPLVEKIKTEANLNLRKLQYSDNRINLMTDTEKNNYMERKKLDEDCKKIIEEDILKSIDDLTVSLLKKQKDSVETFLGELNDKLNETKKEINDRRVAMIEGTYSKFAWQNESQEMTQVRVNYECRSKEIYCETWEEEKKLTEKYLEYIKNKLQY